MNCQNCKSIIHYNYLTDCPQCGAGVEQCDLPKLDRSTAPGQESGWSYRLANSLLVLLTSVAGMISGAVVLYFSAALLYIALASPETYPGQHCGRGMAIGMLSILAGGFLGTVGGTAFGIKHLISSPENPTQPGRARRL
jgi:hypothetical protein